MRDAAATGEWHSAPAASGYELLGELGRGGVGVVYRAKHLATGRMVALKFLRDGALAGDRDRARFRTEIHAVAALRHPNVVAVYEVGASDDEPFFAMELVGGGSLAERLDGRPQPIADAAELVRTLAVAVGYAHANRIVHRDLKPANVLLCAPLDGEPPSTFGVPKIADFGLAKRLDSDSTTLTQEGAVLGTAAYMAPEQAAGRNDEIGPASDVYALGAILYELLVGRPPFHADSWHALLEAVLRDDPTPPARLRPEVPADLETVCLKCLEKEPGLRYATADELAEELAAHLAGRPIAASPPSAFGRLTRSAARHGYELLAEIGRGPSAVVYRGVHGTLKLPVAVKIYEATEEPRAAWDARQRQIAERWANVAHPNVQRVQAAGWFAEAPFTVADFAPQGSLAATLGAAPAPLRETLPLVASIAETVGYLHRQGVVHGNLKPSNILLAADGIPRIADPYAGGPLPRDPASLARVPPELLTPSAELLLTADVYGLGLILYELAACRPPFAGATVEEVAERLRTETPPAPSQFNREATPYFDAVCLRCLRADPWRRYSRAHDVLRSLHRLLDELPVRPLR